MFILRRLDQYIIKSYYHNDSNRLMYTINTIISPDLIYECYSGWFYGKLLTQGNYIISLTHENNYLVYIIYLYKPMKSIIYSQFNADKESYIELYNYYNIGNWNIKLYDSNSILSIDKKIWDKITPCFKYTKYNPPPW